MTVRIVFSRVLCIVLDGFGVGELPDAGKYDDCGANSLANTANALGGLKLPNLEKLGLGRITPTKGVAPVAKPLASFGKAAEKSSAKDSVTGHWELMGFVTPKPFVSFPKGFPTAIIEEFCRETGLPGVLGNKPASGTVIIEELGAEHLRTKLPIVYTSVDSVFQIAAHTDVIPLPRLYEICEAARRVCDRHGVGRVIARPFIGKPGAFRRTYDRKDFSMQPSGDTVLDRLKAASIPVLGIGKIQDLFGGKGVLRSIHTEGNRDGMAATLGALLEMPRGFIFSNLVDFDMLYGHRRDPQGYAKALAEFDEDLGVLLEKLQPGDLLLLTSDHGNDPTFSATTDHTREFVPVLLYDPANREGRDLGVRTSFADVGATVAEALGVKAPSGKAFLPA